MLVGFGVGDFIQVGGMLLGIRGLAQSSPPAPRAPASMEGRGTPPGALSGRTGQERSREASGKDAPFYGADGRIVSGSIAEVSFRRLGGLAQRVMVRGEAVANA
jgi:hypothetical protein